MAENDVAYLSVYQFINLQSHNFDSRLIAITETAAVHL